MVTSTVLETCHWRLANSSNTGTAATALSFLNVCLRANEVSIRQDGPTHLVNKAVRYFDLYQQGTRDLPLHDFQPMTRYATSLLWQCGDIAMQHGVQELAANVASQTHSP